MQRKLNVPQHRVNQPLRMRSGLPGQLPQKRKAAPPLAALPSGLSAAAIVSVCNEEHTVGKVIAELKRLKLQDIIVVINGSTDGSFERIASVTGITIVHIPEPIGHDVGRALGAKLAQADILLFVDGDFPIPAEQLAPFLLSVHQGADVALNDIMPFMHTFRHWDAVSRVKEFLNRCMGRADLRANSLTSVPHALSRRAVELIGAPLLMVPPAAHSAAIIHGLRFTTPASINVIAANRVRVSNIGMNNKVERMIVGDHVEALRIAMRQSGPRLSWRDEVRRRTACEEGQEEAR
jgi:glycosyltransferase involved in cell wall biosynthesis